MWIQSDEELPPSMGVREPREPKPPSLTGGAEAQLEFEPEPQAEAAAAHSGVT